jgi:5,10-methylene-tetrahydrofolate dehydrogenase/methenyl tetrahydrofolate cyclohydrolase
LKNGHFQSLFLVVLKTDIVIAAVAAPGIFEGGVVKQKGGAVTIKIQYFGEKSLESSMKSVSKGGAAAPTSSAVDPPLTSCRAYV